MTLVSLKKLLWSLRELKITAFFPKLTISTCTATNSIVIEVWTRSLCVRGVVLFIWEGITQFEQLFSIDISRAPKRWIYSSQPTGSNQITWPVISSLTPGNNIYRAEDSTQIWLLYMIWQPFLFTVFKICKTRVKKKKLPHFGLYPNERRFSVLLLFHFRWHFKPVTPGRFL